MDAVELARQTAARLHAEAVAAGHDPRRPYEFACKEAARRGLDVERTRPGAQMLDGGRAAFIPADNLILHEDAGTLFEQAFLIMHEIGHAECGDGTTDPAPGPVTIDPARPAEPSPAGFDRVVDYGRKQRREIQMDLFAREFLLPRPIVRRLHVEEDLGLAAIAERFGAPVDVVAQQLLDALLLPSVSLRPKAEENVREPNPEQRNAAAHRGAAYLLEAGPGTGKTQTLIARVESLLAENVDPRRILLLTFSNKAAGEMAERIARRHPEAARAMWIGTFHAFGLDLIRRFRKELGFKADPRMLDRTEAVELLEYEFPRLGLSHYANIYDPTQIIADILSAISRAKDEVVNDSAYLSLAETMKANAPPEKLPAAEKAIEVARVYAVYETLKHSRNCIDFGDLVAIPVQFLECNPAARKYFQQRYDHVLVDEYQDVNRSSIRLLAALRPGGNNLWVVGDARQSIYRFRGASSFNLDRFGIEDFPGGIRGELVKNYRSSAEITAAFTTFAQQMPVGDKAPVFTADRGALGIQPELCTVDNGDLQSAAMAEMIEKLRAAGYAYRDQVVLCSGNGTLSCLGHELERLGIPVLFLGNLFERPESKELFSLLSLLIDRRAMGLVRTACLPEFHMPLADVASVIGYLKSSEAGHGAWRTDTKIAEQLSAEGQAAWRRLVVLLDGFGPESSPWHVLTALLLDRTRMAAQLATSPTVGDRSRAMAIWQVMNFIRAQPAGGQPIQRLLDRIRRLLRLRDDHDLRQLPAAAQGLDAVRLMTIHGAKGLEFGAAHLASMNSDSMPGSMRTPRCPPPDGLVAGGSGTAHNDLEHAHKQERECLFYVACSRAKDRLIAYAATQNIRGARRQSSPFLSRLGIGITTRHVHPTHVLPPAPELAAIALHVEGSLRFTAQQVSLYETCPRRFFFTHILSVGGCLTATPFMQMHEAVRTVFKELKSQGADMTLSDLEQRMERAFATHGLSGHGYESHYRDLALGMIRYFAATREGHTVKSTMALSLKFDDEEILVHPDEILIRPDGRHAVRTVQTGHRSERKEKAVDSAAFVLAAQNAFPNAVIQLVYLADREVREVLLSRKELTGREEKITKYLVDMRIGQFPPKSNEQTCPQCPAFFICGPLPEGKLFKKFD
jgi:superfamily I DNA/RNA helicase